MIFLLQTKLYSTGNLVHNILQFKTMFKDDYIMKMVRQAGRIFARVVNRVRDNAIDEAEEIAEAAAQEFVGIGLFEAERDSADNLAARLSPREQGGVGELLMLADLLRAKALIYEHDDNEEAAFCARLLALQIRLKLAIGFDLSNAHLDSTVSDLSAQLEEYVLPTPTVYQLFVYYEKTQQYDEAEEVLWELVNEHIAEQDMIQEGLAFYERLLQKTDSELSVGNMDREEVQDGFNELWERA